MRVLIVHPYMTFYGGAELVIVKLANYLTSKKIENAVLTLDITPEIKRELKGSKIILPKKPLRFSPQTPYTATLLPTTLALKKHLRKNIAKFDVINVHNFPAELAAFSCSKKVVWMCNEPPKLNFAGPSRIEKTLGGFITAIDKRVVKRYVDKVCVADEFNAARFKKIYGIKPVTVPYGIDCKFFSKGNGNKAKRAFHLEKGNFVILQVGMVTPFKNQLESIKVVKKLVDKIPNIKLIIAGYGGNEYEKMLKKYVRKWKLLKNVVFTGHLSRATVRDLYAACDVALFPVKAQGGWLSPFEALCAQAPIIVSNQMTASNLVKKNKLGIVTQNFERATLDVYKHPGKYKRTAALGKKWVNENLSWEKFGEKMITCFEK